MNSPGSSDRSEDRNGIEIARINARQIIIVTIITAVSGLAGALIQGMFAAGKIDSLSDQLRSSTSKVEGLQKDLEGPGASAVEREALYRLTTDYIEGDIVLTAGKGGPGQPDELSDTELNYRRLKRAVFLNVGPLRANRTILENTLQMLTQRGRGWIEGQRARIIAEFPELRATRLRWLEDVAIPRLQQSIDEIATRPMVQSLPNAKVPLPREVWILNHAPGDEPTVTVSSIVALKDEVELLKRTL
jgi:hypothetical protein